MKSFEEIVLRINEYKEIAEHEDDETEKRIYQRIINELKEVAEYFPELDEIDKENAFGESSSEFKKATAEGRFVF